MHSSPALPFPRRSFRLARRLAPLAAGLAAFVPAAAAAPAATPAAAPPLAAANIALDGFVFEAGQPIPGQLVVRNDGGGWLKTEELADLASSLRLTLPGGDEVRPSGADLFGAARAKEIGAGGFVGVKFDLLKLFPQLAKEGSYKVALKRGGMPSPSVSFRVIPAFDAAKSYRLLLTTPDGELAIDLSREAPQSVRALVTLVRTGYFDKAAIGALRPGFAFSVVSTQPAGPRVEPFERTSRELLVGTVVLEPGPPDANGNPSYNNPALLVLLAPRPDWQGRTTAIGQLAGGDETLSRLVQRPTSGERGLPPWKPVAPVTVESVRVVENR
jgi:cyclophilin family peptidyl-prolyl cis-trans isomerase